MNAREKSLFRIGRKLGAWQIKQAPGWKVVARCATLAECAEWFRRASVVDINTVPVTSSQHPWPMLGECLEKNLNPN